MIAIMVIIVMVIMMIFSDDCNNGDCTFSYFQWSVDQLMQAEEHGRRRFLSRRSSVCCYSNIHHPYPLMYYISMHPMFGAHIGTWQALHCKSIEEYGHWWLSWRKTNKSHIVRIYIDAFLRCHQIWKVETLLGRWNFLAGF